jgi:hypothetical protein
MSIYDSDSKIQVITLCVHLRKELGSNFDVFRYLFETIMAVSTNFFSQKN